MNQIGADFSQIQKMTEVMHYIVSQYQQLCLSEPNRAFEMEEPHNILFASNDTIEGHSFLQTLQNSAAGKSAGKDAEDDDGNLPNLSVMILC